MAVTEYMTEHLLRQFAMERLVDTGSLIFDKPLMGRFRPDIFVPDKQLIVEFDGYRHYSQAHVILADAKKDELFRESGYTIVRCPYFVQLQSLVVRHLFGSYVNDSADFNVYPHGFIDNKALLPADFNELGVTKFRNNLRDFAFIKDDIVAGLENKVRQLGDPLRVYPPSLLSLRT